MSGLSRPHVLGIDDGPFEKGQDGPVPIVAVMMEGADLVESIAVAEFPVDGAGVTEFLAEWITGLRMRDAVQAVVLGGITMAGLGIVDVELLAESLSLPVVVVTRKDTTESSLDSALDAAGLGERRPIVQRAPRAFRLRDGLFVAQAGADRATAERIVRACTAKAKVPEPLRVAHLIARALVSGESRGRV